MPPMTDQSTRSLRGNLVFRAGKFTGWACNEDGDQTPVQVVAQPGNRVIWSGTPDEERPQSQVGSTEIGFSFAVPGSEVVAGNWIELRDGHGNSLTPKRSYIFTPDDEQWVPRLTKLANLPLLHFSSLNKAHIAAVHAIGNHESISQLQISVENATGEHELSADKIDIIPGQSDRLLGYFWFAPCWPNYALRLDLASHFADPLIDGGVPYVILRIHEDGVSRPVTDRRDIGHVPADSVTWPDETSVRRTQAAGVLEQKFGSIGFSHYRTYRSVYEELGGTWDDMSALLDWGSGAGRVTQHYGRHLGWERVFGVDVDAENVKWCQEHLNLTSFSHCDVTPPLPYADETFDYITATSVLTHIPGDMVDAWLDELYRVLRPGGIAALSVGTETRVARGSYSNERLDMLEEKGYEDSIRNPQLNGVVDDADYYRNVRFSKDFIAKTWTKKFELVKIFDHAIGVQDIVALRKNA